MLFTGGDWPPTEAESVLIGQASSAFAPPTSPGPGNRDEPARGDGGAGGVAAETLSPTALPCPHTACPTALQCPDTLIPHRSRVQSPVLQRSRVPIQDKDEG